MHRLAVLTLAAAAFATAGCTTTMGSRAGPVEATRYHLGAPIERGTISLEPLASTDTISPEYRLYADAVAAELARIGYVPATDSATSDYIAGVAFTRAPIGVLRERPPVSIGLGGGSGGLFGGLNFGIGGGNRELIVSELWVQLRRRSDNTVVWEGRAQAEAVDGAATAQPSAVAQRLADALFRGFPGESGITITVP
ncbi:DUF4136 domain-containing protein [Sphingosinithalassobacter sp. CS137]|uniref:DUF4136 domain-containing protein n=1 Tax=Sphingosinithalassobacter sp. CS137 TaxID=2762748 RepID=UPI00165E150A|nr:DUF4136 domain-containing protein [Sphingosinithalassobacter sp. CS137]